MARALVGVTIFGVASAHSALGEGLQKQRSSLSTFYLTPTRIVWQSPGGVKNANQLLRRQGGQVLLGGPSLPTELRATRGRPAGVLLDFGTELQGSVEIFVSMMEQPTREPLRSR